MELSHHPRAKTSISKRRLETRTYRRPKIATPISIGIKVLMKGYKVLLASVSEMLKNLNASKAGNSYYQKVGYYLNPDLLVLDELGFKKLPVYGADDFFEIISKRYEKGSLIITTNKTFE